MTRFKQGKKHSIQFSTDRFHESTNNQWISVIKALNPLGPIADAFANALAYKLETKRLASELEQMESQAKIAHRVTRNTFRLKMEQLQHRRIALIGFYNTVNNELQRLHIERKTVLEMAQLAQKKSFEGHLSIDERKMLAEMSVQCIKELKNFGDKSNESLQKLVQVLPPIDVSKKLLGG